jgi:hypothetical protein
VGVEHHLGSRKLGWVGMEIMAKMKHASLLFEMVNSGKKRFFFLSCPDFFIFKGNSSLFIGHQMLRTDQIL